MPQHYLFVLLVFLLLEPGFLIWGMYKSRQIQVRPAREYVAHQDFQGMVIAAYPCDTEEKSAQFFDTDKLYEKGFMPVLVVVENNNSFAIRIYERDIFYVDQDGNNVPSISANAVLLEIALKKSPSEYPSRPEKLLRQTIDEEMLADFEHKAFGEKLISPKSSDYGVVFFRLPENRDLSESRLYLPEIQNVTDSGQLMFFEFELGTKEE